MGRHHAARSRGHGKSSPLLYGSILLVLSMITWLTLQLFGTRLGAPACEDPVELTVTAAPAIAPAVRDIAAEQLPEADDELARCLRVDTRSASSATVLDALAKPGMAARSLGSPTDVWIPDGSAWLELARGTHEWKVPASGVPIASSPVVFAAPESPRERSDKTGRGPDADALLEPESDRKIGVADPTAHTAELYAVHSMVSADGSEGATTARLRELARRGAAEQDELYRAAGSELDAFPTSEQKLVRHNRNIPHGKTGSMTASYTDSLPWLDFPYTVLPPTDKRQRSAAERFLELLRGEQAARTLGAHGFRTPKGALTGKHRNDTRLSRADAAPVDAPNGQDLNVTLQQWAKANAVGKVLSVMDVSGSMQAQVPGTDKNRMQVTVEAAAGGIKLFNPATELSYWEFSTQLDGDKDYRRLLPYQPVREQIEEMAGESGGDLVDSLDRLFSEPQGATGLYDTTLAAYREAMRNWTPGRMNSVVIMTDGRNEDENGIDLRQLLDELNKLADPQRPLPIVLIGLGTDVNPDELSAITQVTGGQEFLAPKVTDIRDIFFTALSRMACPDESCGS